MNNLLTQIELYKRDQQHGASQLLFWGLEILQTAARVLPASGKAELGSLLFVISDDLAACRPTMVNIINGMNIFKTSLDKAVTNSKDCGELREQIDISLNQLMAHLNKSAHKIAINGAKLITSKTTVLTCSYSSSVIRAFTAAHRQGIKFRVLAMQSEYQGQSYGPSVLQALEAEGIEGEVVPDMIIEAHLSNVDLILIGADALYINHCLVNGYPSLDLIELANRATPNIPAWALVDNIKIAQTFESINIEPGFQGIPLKYFSGIISEKGIIIKNNIL